VLRGQLRPVPSIRACVADLTYGQFPDLLLLPPPEQIAVETLAEQPAVREIAFLLGTYPDVFGPAMRLLRIRLREHENERVRDSFTLSLFS
jgi:hypothetical protein